MKKQTISFFLLSTFVLSIAQIPAARAVPKGVDLIPTREIDAKFTIPEGTMRWHGALVGDRLDHATGLTITAKDAFRLIPFPLVWEIAASDDITWSFGFIGVGVRANIAKNKTWRAGARTFIQNNAPADIDFGKYFHETAFEGRFFFSRWLALDFSAQVNGSVSFRDIRSSYDTYIGQLGGTIGPLFQATEHWAFSTWVGYHRVTGFLASQYIPGSIFLPTEFDQPPLQRSWEWVSSTGVNSWIYLNPNWQFKASYQISGIGSSQLVRMQTVTIDLMNTW